MLHIYIYIYIYDISSLRVKDTVKIARLYLGYSKGNIIMFRATESKCGVRD